MPDEEAPLQTLTFYGFKPVVRTLEECLDPEVAPTLTSVAAPVGAGSDARLYYKAGRVGKPSWAPFLEGGVGRELPLATQSSSALLLVKRPSGFFAIPFGPSGRFWIRSEIVQEGFGLKVALNAVDPLKIRSADSQSIDDHSKYKREQASRQVPFREFDFDANQAILSGVTGEPRDPGFAKRVHGSESARIAARLHFNELGTKCDAVQQMSERTDYKATFPWLDSLQTVKDAELVARLDAGLIGRLQAGDLGNAHLAPPEVVNWDWVDGFRYPGMDGGADPDPDPSLATCLAALGELTKGRLERARLRAVGGDHGDALHAWPLYKCLVAEIRLEERRFLLSAGKWFEVDPSYVRRVERRIARIRSSDLALPPCPVGALEREYNALATDGRKDWVTLDGKVLKPADAASGIEVCDILTERGDFVHVKKRNSSATLSHLFAQGRVSAQTLLADDGFRRQARTLVRRVNTRVASAIAWEELKSEGVDVVYAVISDRPSPTSLPFFAKVNLLHSLHTLELMGCRVRVASVGIRGPSD